MTPSNAYNPFPRNYLTEREELFEEWVLSGGGAQ